MKKLLLILFVSFFLISKSFPQLLNENFDYGGVEGNLTAQIGSIWTNHSGTESFIQYSPSGLFYLGYPSSGIGGSINLLGGSGSREDINTGITTQTGDGTIIFCSFLINVSVAKGTADYFIHLGDRTSPSSFSDFAARVFVQDVSGKLRFGISNTSTSDMGINDYDYNTTYLIIIKYSVNLNGEDECKLWVFSESVPVDELSAGMPEKINISSGQNTIDAIGLRQGSVAYSVIIDGIRISNTWSQAPLPVELTSFISLIHQNSVQLNWQTATEVNNYGFNVERRESSLNDWLEIGFVEGNGNSNSIKNYCFTDNTLSSTGKYFYRLKQMDNDGKYEYSKEIEVNFNPDNNFILEQNYPNPFNPVTKIKYTIPEAGNVTLKLYDMLGREITTLVQDIKEAGIHEVEFSAADIPSGIYIYQLNAGTFIQTRKMTLIK